MWLLFQGEQVKANTIVCLFILLWELFKLGSHQGQIENIQEHIHLIRLALLLPLIGIFSLEHEV